MTERNDDKNEPQKWSPCPFCGSSAFYITQQMNGAPVSWVQCASKFCGGSAKPGAWEQRSVPSATLPPSIDKFNDSCWIIQYGDGSIWNQIYERKEHGERELAGDHAEFPAAKLVEVRLVAVSDGGGA